MYDIGVKRVSLVENASGVIQPVNVSYHESITIQTHNAVSVVLSSTSFQSSWMDTLGYTELDITLANDAATTSSVDVVWSNDGTNTHGRDYSVVPSNTNQYKSGNIQTRARYAKLVLSNGDGALAHTMSAWAYLKA